MSLSNMRYNRIKNAVINLFIDCKVGEIPIDLDKICKFMNAVLVPYSSFQLNEVIQLMKSGDGCHHYKDGILYIFYDDFSNIGRQRFTILHEIGHIVLRHKEFSLLAEEEANFFAAYALCPNPLVDLYNIDDYTQLSEIFNLSCECAKHSLNRYKMWKKYHNCLTEQEQKLLDLFTDLGVINNAK